MHSTKCACWAGILEAEEFSHVKGGLIKIIILNILKKYVKVFQTGGTPGAGPAFGLTSPPHTHTHMHALNIIRTVVSINQIIKIIGPLFYYMDIAYYLQIRTKNEFYLSLSLSLSLSLNAGSDN